MVGHFIWGHIPGFGQYQRANRNENNAEQQGIGVHILTRRLTLFVGRVNDALGIRPALESFALLLLAIIAVLLRNSQNSPSGQAGTLTTILH